MRVEEGVVEGDELASVQHLLPVALSLVRVRRLEWEWEN